LTRANGCTILGALGFLKLEPNAAPSSSSGLGHLVLSQETGVRFPVGVLFGTLDGRALAMRQLALLVVFGGAGSVGNNVMALVRVA